MYQVEHEKCVPLIRYITKLVRALHYGEPMPPKPESLSWRDIFAHSYTHSVASTIWYLVEDEVTREGNEELVRRWSRERDLDFAKCIHQTRAFATIKRAFRENAISYLPMKGSVYRDLWARPEFRTMSDLDILVSPECLDKAREVLSSLGYTLDHTTILHDNFVKQPYVNIELHRVIKDENEVVDFSRYNSLPDDPYHFEMTREDFLLENIMHMHKHYRQGGCGIRSLFDLHLYLERYKDEIDMPLLQQKLDENGVRDYYYLMVNLSEFWYGDGSIEPTDDIYKEEYYISSGATYGTTMNRVRFDAKTEGKFSYIWRRAFLPFDLMTKHYSWLKKLPFLLPIAWVMRWFRGLSEGKVKKEMGAIESAEWKGNKNEDSDKYIF